MAQQGNYIDSGAPARCAQEGTTVPGEGRRAFLGAELTLPVRVFFSHSDVPTIPPGCGRKMAALALALFPLNQRFSDISIKAATPLEEPDTVHSKHELSVNIFMFFNLFLKFLFYLKTI